MRRLKIFLKILILNIPYEVLQKGIAYFASLNALGNPVAKVSAKYPTVTARGR
jgi:hypothetical protein